MQKSGVYFLAFIFYHKFSVSATLFMAFYRVFLENFILLYFFGGDINRNLSLLGILFWGVHLKQSLLFDVVSCPIF